MKDLNLSPSELAETFTMPADGSTGRREKPGWKKRDRLQYNKEAYCYIDPDYLATLGEPPADILRQFQEVFGEWTHTGDGVERLKLRVHPHFHRWCLWEKTFIPSLGKNLWKNIWICQDDPVKGVLPGDLAGDPLKAHFTGTIGAFRMPTKADFIEVEQYNRKKYGVDTVNERAGAWQHAEETALNAAADEQIERFLDENWFLAWDEANQAAGSGQYMRSSHCANWTRKGNVERYRRVQKNGYVLIEKKSREDFEKELAAWTVRLLKKSDRLIVEQLLRERLSGMPENDLAAEVEALTPEQGAQLAKLAQVNKTRVLAALKLRKAKTL